MRRPFDIQGKNDDGNDDVMIKFITRKLPHVAKCRPLRALKSVGRMVSPCSQKFVSRPWKVSVQAERIIPVPIRVFYYVCRSTKKRTPKNWEQGKVKCLHLESKITAMAMLVGELNQFLFLCVRYTYGWKAEKSQPYWRVIYVIDELHFISGERQISISFEWWYFSSIELVKVCEVTKFNSDRVLEERAAFLITFVSNHKC